MSIQLRGRKFHYRFQFQGVNHSGVCVGCDVSPDMDQKAIAAIRKKAAQFEENEKTRVLHEVEEQVSIEREVRRNRSVVALVENYKYELTGGHPIQLSEAFALAEAKPSKRKAKSSYAALRKTYWNDFVQFMSDKYSEVTDLASVRRAHCEAYVNYLVEEYWLYDDDDLEALLAGGLRAALVVFTSLCFLNVDSSLYFPLTAGAFIMGILHSKIRTWWLYT